MGKIIDPEFHDMSHVTFDPTLVKPKNESQHKRHPVVKADVGADDVCSIAIKRLKAGPPNIPKVIADNAGVWEDPDFNGVETIAWNHGSS